MSHEIENRNGKDCTAWAGETPWHGLGTKVDANISAADMMAAAGLDWSVEKRSIFAEVGKKRVRVGNKKALVRIFNDDTAPDALDVVGNDWNPVQNETAFNFFHDFVEAGDMEMHTAGSLRGGRIVWCLAKMKEDFEIVKGDRIEPFILFTNPHVYGRTVEVRQTPTRVVCWNTLSMALAKDATNSVKVSHNLVFDAEEVKKTMGLAKLNNSNYREKAGFLAGKFYDDDRVKEFFDKVFPRTSDAKGKNEPSKQYHRALELLETQPGAEFAPGSWWNAFNAATFITNHEMGSDARRLENVWYGGNVKRNEMAMELALEMAA